MGRDSLLSPLGPSRHDSQQSFNSVDEQKSLAKNFYAVSTSNSEVFHEAGRSCTTLAAEQVHSSSVIQWWWIEIGASVLSIVTMFGLIAVLSLQDGKPIRTWDHGNITVNTVVAAISTLNRISLMFPVSGAISQAMWIWFAGSRKSERAKSRLEDLEIFDEASRGAWGSVQLLWRLKHTVHLASIGAILTIASLAFDIFAQQVLGYETMNVAGTNTSLYTAGDVPRLETFTEYTHGAVMSQWVPTLPAKAAIRNSFFADSVTALSVPCSTGNCTWPTVPSVAVCGECKPTTFTKTCAPLNNISSYDSCNYTMPSGTQVNVVEENLFLNLVFNAEPTTTGNIYNMSDPTIPYISIFDAMYTPYNASTPNPTWTDISATECALWFCMQAYDTNINDSITHQTSTNHSEIIPVEDPILNVTAYRNFTNIPSTMNTMSESSYSVKSMSLISFQNFIWSEKMFDGNISANSAETSSSSDYMLELWYQSADLDAWIKRLAEGLTNYIRTNDPSVYMTNSTSNSTIYSGNASSLLSPTQDAYRGTAYFSQIHVKVRWGWLTFPLGLVALSVLFLILSIVRTRGSYLGAWKSSPLALLFADVEGGIRQKAGATMNKAGGLQKSVGEVRAELRAESGARWVFREKSGRVQSGMKGSGHI